MRPAPLHGLLCVSVRRGMSSVGAALPAVLLGETTGTIRTFVHPILGLLQWRAGRSAGSHGLLQKCVHVVD